MSVVGPSVTLQRLLNNGLQYARVRLEILELELIEERQRLGSMLTRGMLLALAVLTTTQFIAMLIVAAFWDTQWRLHAIGVLVAAALIGTATAWFSLGRLRREPARPLSAAMRDLDQAIRPGIE